MYIFLQLFLRIFNRPNDDGRECRCAFVLHRTMTGLLLKTRLKKFYDGRIVQKAAKDLRLRRTLKNISIA
ncbi:hypothetical protein niasHT_013846 [Heterodera trifolii]|uniref:Uncharacterized protein n=1 Tax=Heterodera trifolii TaxID=157864 RepID=A0ABD2LFY1_9BILA